MESTPFIRSRAFLFLGAAYLIFALVVTLAGQFPELRSFIPEGVYSLFSPNDKTNLAWYRIVHFAILAFFVVRFVPRDWKGLESPLFAPAIVCGQQSLEVFVVCRTFRSRRGFGCAADADFGQCGRDRGDDGPRLLSILVKEGGEGEACTCGCVETRTCLGLERDEIRLNRHRALSL